MLVLIVLLSPMWRREVARQRRREDCCNYFRKSFFNKDNINYKTSILYRHSAVASCHFPRLLGKARPYYLIVPLLNHRFREMFRRASLAQHDKKKKGVIPSEVEESRGNETLGLFTLNMKQKRKVQKTAYKSIICTFVNKNAY